MRRYIVAAAACALSLGACAADDDDLTRTDSAPAVSSSAPSSAPPTAGASHAPLTYSPTTDVAQHRAIGLDVAAIRELLEPTDPSAEPGFAPASTIWSDGNSSAKSDGSKRTLAGFVMDHPAGKAVMEAFAGTGSADGLTTEQRVEWIDKGMTVALKVKALEELDAAKEKLAAGAVDPVEGATHNVDEAWAFLAAEGNGVLATASKRSVDFALGEHDLGNDVIAAMQAAQDAIGNKDAGALDKAIEEARGAMNRIFALAVKKYAAAGETDATARAEGLAFSWGLVDHMSAAGLKTIQDALGADASAGAGESVAAALDAAAGELGITDDLPPYPLSSASSPPMSDPSPPSSSSSSTS